MNAESTDSPRRLALFRDLFRAGGARTRRSLLRRLGVSLVEFYWIEESNDEARGPSDAELPEGFRWGRISEADLPEIRGFNAPTAEVDPALLETILARGDIGHGVRHHGKLVAITCAALDATHVWLHPIALKPNEAYLHHIFVRPEYRGRGLAGILRSCSIQELGRQGRDHIYSITLTTNAASLRVKEKLGARILFRAAAIKIGPVNWRWIVRRYSS